jgi:hypothetical protein
MNREDIIRMAQEADIKFKTDVFRSDFCDGVYEYDLEAFAALVASAEREACAMECLKKANAWTRLGAWGSNNEFHECAEAIRARGQA